MQEKGKSLLWAEDGKILNKHKSIRLYLHMFKPKL